MARHTLARARGLAAASRYSRDPNDGGGGGTGGGDNTGGGTGGTTTGDNAGGTGGGTGGDTAKTFTQAELDQAISTRLERERRAAEAKVTAANRTADQKIADLEAAIAEERLARTRIDVATRTPGLGAEWAEDLKGATAEELEAHAKRLAERLGKTTTVRPGTARTSQRRTVTEAATEPASKKAAAVAALRGMRSGVAAD